MKLPKYLNNFISLIEKNNYQVYVVGGAIRDYLLKIDNHDFDLTTNMPYEKIVSLCNDNHFKINTQGIKHETIGIVLEHNYIEVTCFRGLDKSKLEQDLKLRDFTINSLAYLDNEIIDVTSGINDLNNKLLKSYNPSVTFNTDPLRILRMYRFVAKYGFDIEKNTYEIALKLKDKLKEIAVERIQDELNKIIIYNPFILTTMAKDKILDVLFSELRINIDTDSFNNYINSYFSSSIGKKKNNIVNNFLFLLSLSHSCNIKIDVLAKFLIKKYKYSNDFSTRIKKLLNVFNYNFTSNSLDDLFYIVNNLKFDSSDLDNLFIINTAIKNDKYKNINDIKKVYLNKLKNKEVIFFSDLNISGDIIISLTNKKGKEIGDIKNLLYKECFYLITKNNLESLINRIKTI